MKACTPLSCKFSGLCHTRLFSSFATDVLLVKKKKNVTSRILRRDTTAQTY
jgi:hypothetical protein